MIKELNFDAYYATSAKEGWQVDSLRATIERAIPWDELPTVTSSELFATIKSFLLERKESGRLLAPAGQLFDDFGRQYPTVAAEADDLRADLDVCIWAARKPRPDPPPELWRLRVVAAGAA